MSLLLIKSMAIKLYSLSLILCHAYCAVGRLQEVIIRYAIEACQKIDHAKADMVESVYPNLHRLSLHRPVLAVRLGLLHQNVSRRKTPLVNIAMKEKLRNVDVKEGILSDCSTLVKGRL